MELTNRDKPGLKKALQFSYRTTALTMYKKEVLDLTKEQQKTILNKVLKNYIVYYGQDRNAFKAFFKSVFKEELKHAS